MGLNYFVIKKKSSIRRHIGKLSYGWKFIFHGYDYLYFNVNLKSRKEWEKYLLSEKLFVYNTEEDEIIDTNEFLKLVEESKSEKKIQPLTEDYKEWYDNEGFLFCDHYFS